ncbi:hypothetical protein V6N11_074745 [Hibiscus sabdariffa]|uniref:SLC26A/SulP transporter domain-containing protein n=1 Tax=Hibiscus sabdariffa TaxID=183260 RepID=A0ABR2R4F6_9ROSI
MSDRTYLYRLSVSSPSSRRGLESLPYIHKVGMPPKQSLLKEIAVAVKETLFADEPLRQFKDQPNSRYLCIPQDIGYAKLGDLDPQYGLYSSFVPPLVYAFMGSSRDIAIGPVAVGSLLLGSLLQDEIDSSANPVEYRRLRFTATFFAGLTQLVLGFFRKGINPPSAKEIFFSGEYVGKDYQLDGNKEMVAIGTMTIVGPLTSCYVDRHRVLLSPSSKFHVRL